MIIVLQQMSINIILIFCHPPTHEIHTPLNIVHFIYFFKFPSLLNKLLL